MQPFTKKCEPRQIEVKVEWLLNPDPIEVLHLEKLPDGQKICHWDAKKCSNKNNSICPQECWYISLGDGKDPFLAENW
jgi:endonuclease III